MANRFRLTSALSETDKIDRALKDYYKSWRELNQKSKSSFTAIDNSFFTEKILRDLEPGPLRLYLYFSHAANNDYGHSWHSISKIAEYFDTQTRTIDNWIKGLVDKDLIYRAQKENKSHNTYIIPFSNTLITHPAPKKRTVDDQDLLEDLLAKIKDLQFLYGEIVKVHHLFQWTSSKGKPITKDNSIQMLLIITKRANGILIGHYHILRKSSHLSVSELVLEEQSIFKSPFVYNNTNITGIALTPIPSLGTRAAIKDTIDLVSELESIEDWQLRDRPQLEYGNKDEILPDLEVELNADEDDNEEDPPIEEEIDNVEEQGE
jgi:hypothetical protein